MFEHLVKNIYMAIIVLMIGTYLLNKVADLLGEALHVVGLKMNLPHSVRGATFDAAASSLPEFCTAFIAIYIYNEFNDIGIATVGGSGVFNVLLIPMFSIIFFKAKDGIKISVQKSVVYRDMFFYTLVLLVLLGFTFYGEYNFLTGLLLVICYMFYLLYLWWETKKHRKTVESRDDELADTHFGEASNQKLTMIVLGTLLGIYVLMEAIIAAAVKVADEFNIAPFIVSLIILAACTSIPDVLLSIKSSKRGDIEGALGNAVGSNIFDIAICIGIPILFSGKSFSVTMAGNGGLMVFLFISMIVTSILVLKKSGIKKYEANYLLLTYLIFIGYLIKTH